MKTLRNISCIAIAVVVSLGIAGQAEAVRVLFLGRNPGVGVPPEPTWRGDPAAFDHLQAVFGADNVVFMEGNLTAGDGSSANGYDVVFISGGMASSNTRNKYEDSNVGIVSGEHAIMGINTTAGNMQMTALTGGSDGLLKRNYIDIQNSSHPLAAGLSGHVRFFTSDTPSNDPDFGTQWSQYGTGAMAPGVFEVARWDTTAAPGLDNPERVIYAAEKGAQLGGDGSPGFPSVANSRRVFFGAGDFHGSDLTADGFKLFEASIAWAATRLPGDFNKDGVVDAADYVVWRDNVGTTNVLPNDNGLAGTINAVTGVTIGQAHYDLWRANVGNSSAGVGSLAGASVPEPASCCLTLIALLGAVSRRRRTSRSM